MDFIMTNLNDLLIAISSIVTGASAICAIAPNGKKDNFFSKMKKVLDVLALNIGNAKRA